MKPKALQRPRMITMRVSEEEKRYLKRAAAKLNLPVSHLVYESAFRTADAVLNHEANPGKDR